MQKTFSIKTLGCKLNQYESSLIAGQFLENGWITRPFGDIVDIVIINTCTVTNRSDKKCRNYIRQGAGFAKRGKVLVTGCFAERGGSLKNSPDIFAVVKNSDKQRIFSIANEYYRSIFQADEIALNIDNDDESTESPEYPLPFYRTRGLLKIQDGCDGECSYCVVPAVRGKPVSRDFNEIITHAWKLIDSGCPELILTGITIGKYNSGDKNLVNLIKEIIGINGNFRVRISSIEPKHVSDELIELISSDKVCSHLHIPLQSGSDKILGMMKRPYSSADYLNLVAKIRKINNDISLGTDVIIGFPGETEDDFNLTSGLVNDAQFSYVHQFTFSPRSGTPASSMKRRTDKEILNRSARLRELSSGLSLEYKKRFMGKDLPSVIEKNKNKEGYRAVSGNYIKMDIKKALINFDITGRILNVRLSSIEGDRCTGVLI